jgi:hypothetical protein
VWIARESKQSTFRVRDHQCHNVQNVDCIGQVPWRALLYGLYASAGGLGSILVARNAQVFTSTINARSLLKYGQQLPGKISQLWSPYSTGPIQNIKTETYTHVVTKTIDLVQTVGT